jgi:hypothetical protein
MKVQLPHERYEVLAAALPDLIMQAMQRVLGPGVQAVPLSQHPQQEQPSEDARLPLLTQHDAAHGHDGAAPCALTHYTHLPGCLTAVMELDSGCASTPAAEQLAAELRQLLPAGMDLVHVSTKQRAVGSGSSCSGGGSSCGGSVDGSSTDDATLAGGAWPDPVVLVEGAGSCIVHVILPAEAMRQLPAGAAQLRQVRVALAAAGGSVLCDRIVSVDTAGQAGCDGRLEVRAGAEQSCACNRQAPAGPASSAAGACATSRALHPLPGANGLVLPSPLNCSPGPAAWTTRQTHLPAADRAPHPCTAGAGA